METFLKFFNEQRVYYPMHLQITYSKICDWRINLFKRGVLPDGGDLIIFCEQHSDIEYLCAKAQVALKDHLSEYQGGY